MVMDDDYLAIVRRLLTEHVPEIEVWAFGSRVQGTPKPQSDLDLALVNDQRLPVDRLARLSLSFEESNLPFRVDLVELMAATPEFRAIVERQYEVVQVGRASGR